MIKRTGASASTWHSMPSVMGPTDSPLVLYMPAKRRDLPRGPRNTSQVPVSVLLSVWLPPPGSPFSSSFVQIKCHLLCEACLDPSRGDPCFLLRLPQPCLHTHSSGPEVYMAFLPYIRAPRHACSKPRPLLSGTLCRLGGLALPLLLQGTEAVPVVHAPPQELARRVLTKCLLMEELHHSLTRPLFPSPPRWGHECL